jgi:hypothetical protein
VLGFATDGPINVAVVQGVMSIADTYRAMSEDVRRLASETKDEAVREAYLALAALWRERSIKLDSAFASEMPNR